MEDNLLDAIKHAIRVAVMVYHDGPGCYLARITKSEARDLIAQVRKNQNGDRVTFLKRDAGLLILSTISAKQHEKRNVAPLTATSKETI